MKPFDISEYCAVKGILQSLDSQQWLEVIFADAFIIAATKDPLLPLRSDEMELWFRHAIATGYVLAQKERQ